MAWRSDDLVTQVRLRCRIPDGEEVMSDAEILSIADEEILTLLTPAVRAAKAEFGVAYTDTTIDGSTVTVRVPSRAQAGGVRDVCWLDADGTLGDSIPRVPLEQVERYRQTASSQWRYGIGFAVVGDKVIVLPDDAGSTGSFTLRLYYHRRPSRLILAADAALITGIAGAVYSASGGVGDVDDTDPVDLIQAKPNFDVLAMDVTASVAGTDITLPAAVTDAAVGDYIAESGTSPVVQLPDVYHPALVAAVAVRVHEALGNAPAAELAAKTLTGAMQRAAKMLAPRVEGEDPAIIDRHSPLRAGRFW